MRKQNNFQVLADKAISSAMKWAREDSLKEGEASVAGHNFEKMVADFNTFCDAKYGSPHDLMVIKEESTRNRYDEVFYILTEVNQRGLLAVQTRELCVALMGIAECIKGFDEDEEEI